MPEIIAIAAVARNGVIGADGRIPWHLDGDLPRFKRLTKGHVLIMGRKTYDSIGRPLPGRTTIVVTRNPDWRADGVETVTSVDAAVDRARQLIVEQTEASAGSNTADPVIFIAGGGDIYRAALPITDRLEITEVDLTPDGDATFPEIDRDQWVEVARDDDHDGFAWVTYGRRAAGTPQAT